MLDYKMIRDGVRTVGDFQRAEEEFQLKKQALQQQLQKKQELDLDALGEQVLIKAASGGQLSPQEEAIGRAYDAKRMGIAFNPATGAQIATKTAFGNLTGVKPERTSNTLPPVFDGLASETSDSVGTNAGLQLPVSGMTPKTAQKVQEEKALLDMKESRDFPQKEADIARIVSQVEELKTHPGMSAVVGMPSWSTIGTSLNPFRDVDPTTGVRQPVSGTDAASFNARLGQVKGAAFLEAYKNLKGTGQITEIEGLKATQALQRMSAATSEDEFKKAADDFIYQTKLGSKLAKERLGLPTQTNEINWEDLP